MDAHETEVLLHGGPILTMAGTTPSYAEAVVVRGESIAFVGRLDEAREAHPDALSHDLVGSTLLPGFIDPHSHFINSLAMSTQVNVSAPPVGPCTSVAEVVGHLRRAAEERRLQPGEVLIGYGYDENQLPEPLTRDHLDVDFPDSPVLVMHVSLHGAVLNSAALSRYGIGPDTETPAGGIIARRPGSSEPLGLVMETAFLPVFANLPAPSAGEELDQVRAGQELYAAAGVTTAQEGATHAPQVALLQRAAAAGALFLDVIAYPFITDMDAVLRDNPPETFGHYDRGLKLGGIKITMDGSPQGRTAYFTTPYLTGGPAGQVDWRGEPTFPQEVFDATLTRCYDAGLQTLFHANGDAAIDMVLAGHERASRGDVAADRRSTVIHSQFVRPDQLARYVDYNLVPSFYTEHAFFFGDTHVANRGAEQAAYLSPMRDAIDLGLRPTNHTDFNVAPIDQMLVLWSAVNRRSRSGSVLGPDQRITAYEALLAITAWSARQHREEDLKGTLEVGKLADLVVLDHDPLTVEPDALRDIAVLETVKRGRTVHARD